MPDGTAGREGGDSTESDRRDREYHPVWRYAAGMREQGKAWPWIGLNPRQARDSRYGWRQIRDGIRRTVHMARAGRDRTGRAYEDGIVCTARTVSVRLWLSKDDDGQTVREMLAVLRERDGQ